MQFLQNHKLRALFCHLANAVGKSPFVVFYVCNIVLLDYSYLHCLFFLWDIIGKYKELYETFTH